jgi:hypothetical protein
MPGKGIRLIGVSDGVAHAITDKRVHDVAVRPLVHCSWT